ncbi:allantoinase AllB [Subtercola boreus]|uniref:allantoinase n=1 Tax=Subtercola boreus TaxID=120213 RepID=A0A3E0WBR5_9MICO|nr:allantoinase AllB [Subtercola boreus]RFA21987.1 allantoinase [Subtercola boreus]RFA22167.1 allantoinase [Subtercola boreus]RFA28029.1 allantoinase [Subtercola boreus]
MAPQSPTPADSTYDLVVRSQRVLVDGTFRPAAVVVRNGTIHAIADIAAPFSAVADVTLPDSQVLLPGIVDTHVHVNEPGRTDWEGFASATRAAAAGGVTTIIDMPLNSIPPTTTPEALALKRTAAARQATVDVGFWGGAIPSSLGHLRELHDAGVFGFKAFLSPSGVDEFPHLSTEQLHLALAELAEFDGLLIVHAEDPAVLAEHENAGGVGYSDFVASRPESSELQAIEHLIEGLRMTGARAHILHLSAASALPAIRAAKADGLRLTVETCPHYLSFAAEGIPDGATQYKCCPPIRDERNRVALWQALLSGDIDLIASDHSPSTRELKLAHGGDFGLAWGGISGLEVSLAAVWTAAHDQQISLEAVSEWMSGSTSRLAALPQKGSLAAGADADFIAFAPDETFTVLADHLEHKNKLTAFEGSDLRGVVHTTWLAGAAVFSRDEAPLVSTLSGRLLTPRSTPSPV